MFLRHDEPSQCWVDIFDSDYFMGKMHRLVGPRRLRNLSAKSVIIGPKATLFLSVRRKGQESTVKLNSRQVIPDLAKTLGGAQVRDAAVVCQD